MDDDHIGRSVRCRRRFINTEMPIVDIFGKFAGLGEVLEVSSYAFYAAADSERAPPRGKRIQKRNSISLDLGVCEHFNSYALLGDSRPTNLAPLLSETFALPSFRNLFWRRLVITSNRCDHLTSQCANKLFFGYLNFLLLFLSIEKQAHKTPRTFIFPYADTAI